MILCVNDDDDNDDDGWMIGVVGALVKVLINSSSECFQGWTVDHVRE